MNKLSSKKKILRFFTCGSVDDGKSTLIGRLLFGINSLKEDQLRSIQSGSSVDGNDLARLTDGLKAEREQSITIDVAYRYFQTKFRKFIVVDTPGHVQYTRNMFTGASNADLAVILIDANRGIVEQTRRHAFIVSLLGVDRVVIAVNKMDRAGYDESVFNGIKEDFSPLARKLKLRNVEFIPVSALSGENVVEKSQKMGWYRGVSLLSFLERVEIYPGDSESLACFPVQWVMLDGRSRMYAGQAVSGEFKIGDSVVSLPAMKHSKVKDIQILNQSIPALRPPISSSILLENEIDLSRGEFLSKEGKLPKITQEIEAYVCWMGEQKLQTQRHYQIKLMTQTARCFIEKPQFIIDAENMEKSDGRPFLLNDIGFVKIKIATPMIHEEYVKNKAMGSFIIIDPATFNTVAAGVILKKNHYSFQ